MNTPYRFLSRTIFIACAFATMASARQFRHEAPQSPERNRLVSFEPYAVMLPDSANGIVYLHYRLAKGFFIATKVSGSGTDQFHSRGELLGELLDENTIPVARMVRSIELTRSGIVDDSRDEVQGVLSFPLSSGNDRIVFDLKDTESGHSFVERSQTVSSRKIPSDSLAAGLPLLLEFSAKDNKMPDSVQAANLGGGWLFGDRGSALIQVLNPRDSAVQLRWKLSSLSHDEDVHPIKLDGSAVVVGSGIPTPSASDNAVYYHFAPAKKSWACIVPLPLERLEPGSYSFDYQVTSGSATVRQSAIIRVIWPSKPQSLNKFDLAVDALHHIATKEEIDEMTSYSSSRSREAFEAFWKKRDPDTTTAYNEVMAEYYRRVDESIRRFSSPNEADGYKSDRGRILILFGAPARTERVFHPGAFATEIWYYPNAKRKFVFTDPNRNGMYILSETDTL